MEQVVLHLAYSRPNRQSRGHQLPSQSLIYSYWTRRELQAFTINNIDLRKNYCQYALAIANELWPP
jgi:hypothetical protein